MDAPPLPTPPARPQEAVVDLDDATLAIRAQQGELRSFEALLRRHQDAMYRVALRTLGDPQDAEDAVQEAFVTAWRQLSHFRADAAFSTWLYRIVVNRCLNAARTKQRHPTSAITAATADRLQGSLPAPDQAAEADAGRSALTAAITALPADQRVCLVLREGDHLGYEEIADIVGTTPDAVRGRIHRARTAVAKAMSAWR